MKITSITGAAAAILLCGQSYAVPAIPEYVSRRFDQGKTFGGGKTDVFSALLSIFSNMLGDDDNAWDFESKPHMCSVYMETRDGGNCWAVVECKDGGRKEYFDSHATWNVCYQGGRQYFNDPRIGDFSITFTERDGEGEGLTHPVLQLKYLDNWKEIPVMDLASYAHGAQSCKNAKGGNCDRGPFICQYSDWDYSSGRTRRWECGVPKIGLGGGDFNSQAPQNAKGYAPGWCGVHVTQYQKSDPSKDQYALEFVIKDANEGGTIGKAGPNVDFGSKLPHTLGIYTGGVDADAVKFAYDKQSWDSNDKSRCSVGAYDNGARQMDCGFTCD